MIVVFCEFVDSSWLPKACESKDRSSASKTVVFLDVIWEMAVLLFDWGSLQMS